MIDFPVLKECLMQKESLRFESSLLSIGVPDDKRYWKMSGKSQNFIEL